MSHKSPLSRNYPTGIISYGKRLPGVKQVIRHFANRRALDLHSFKSTHANDGGAFGHWVIDEAGLPAYQYEMDQYRDARARYPTSDGIDHRDHWHQIGNHRINALASNDGTVQCYLGDRGGVILNRCMAQHLDEIVSKPLDLLDLLRRLTRVIVQIFQTSSRVKFYLYNLWDKYCTRGIERKQTQMLTCRHMMTESRPQMQATGSGARDEASTCYAIAGGFGYIQDGQAAWATAFRYRPHGAEVHRRFGMGYFETDMTYRKVKQIRRVYAPLGDDSRRDDALTFLDDSLLLIDVELQNRRSQAVDLQYYEYWDVNVHQLRLQWNRSGPEVIARGDMERCALNNWFKKEWKWDDKHQMLRFHQELKGGSPFNVQKSPFAIDLCPSDIFLADLNHKPTLDSQEDKIYYYADKSDFFGTGDARQPMAVRKPCEQDNSHGESIDGDPMPYCLVLRRKIHLKPRASIRLRYAYGVLSPDQAASLEFLDKYRDPADDIWATTCDRWKSRLAYFTDGDPVIQREMAWHAYNLQSATVYNEYYRAFLVPQGSAYLYLHGADGAPRDQALYTLPLAYIDPRLARDMLRLIMRLTSAQTGALPYVFHGYGDQSNADGCHAKPSDLDLFFLLALSEYLAATGDLAFLDERVCFYPRDDGRMVPPGANGILVLDHVRAAVTHLFTEISTGQCGLIKIGDGDWSDGVVLEEILRGVDVENTRRDGVSVPNTQMALYVLPLAAAVIESASKDAALPHSLQNRVQDMKDVANQMRLPLTDLKQAAQCQWREHGQCGWYGRAILRDIANDHVFLHYDEINLESQVWALISDLADDYGVQAKLIESITLLLDNPSRIGATLRERGQVWPAISQLLTWGYTRSRLDLAWRSFKRQMFATHARIFPNIWFNIWSGPDGIIGEHYSRDWDEQLKTAADIWRGGTWSSPCTPMTDFPVMNSNPDAMALLGLIRICGIEPAPAGDGLIIAPKIPSQRFMLQLQLLNLDVTPGRIAGGYHAIVDGHRILYIGIPNNSHPVTVRIGDRLLEPVRRNSKGYIMLPIEFKTGDVVKFEVIWDPN